jgi:hypothetical protein
MRVGTGAGPTYKAIIESFRRDDITGLSPGSGLKEWSLSACYESIVLRSESKNLH